MTSTIEVQRVVSDMDAVGWRLAGMEDTGPGWREFMRHDEYPRFMREYDRQAAMLQEEDEVAPWLM